MRRAGLVAIAVSLLGVGLASDTMLRHAVQVLPVVAAAALPAAAAVAVAVFWLAIASMIWLFLAGLPSPISGLFTTAEVILTVGLAGGCLVVLVAAWRGRTARPWLSSIGIALVMFALQAAAMAVSLQPAIATR